VGSKRDPNEPALVNPLVCLAQAAEGMRQPARTRRLYDEAIKPAIAGGFSAKRIAYIRTLRDGPKKPRRKR